MSSLGHSGQTLTATRTRYVMREKLASMGGGSWIEDEHGHRTFEVVGCFRSPAESFLLKDRAGNEVANVRQPLSHVRDVLEVERDGVEMARVNRGLVSPLRDRFDIKLATGTDWRAQGNVLAHEYEIEGDGHRVARASKEWSHHRSAYGVEIEPGHDHALVLAIAAAVDEMRRE